MVAGEIHELKQTNKNSENKILELEMDSLDKDSRIEKYEAKLKYQEGEWGIVLLMCKILTLVPLYWLTQLQVEITQLNKQLEEEKELLLAKVY